MRAKYPKASFHERTLDKLTQVLVILFLIRFTRQIIAFYDGYSLTPMKDIYIGSLLLLIWSGGSAQAARPFVTDDARLTAAGSCQLESWTRLNRASKPSARSEEFWAFPACNPSGNFEVTLGAALGRPLEGPQSKD